MILYTRLVKYVALSLFAIAFVAVQVSADDELENLVGVNPSFEQGHTGWVQGLSGDAQATQEIDDNEAIDGDKCAYIDVTEITGTNWHVGLTHNLMPIESGEQYTFDFFAKASAPREISIEVKRTPGGGLPYEGVTSQVYTINEEWAEYFKTFTPVKDYPDENGQTAQICFWFGQAISEVWLDGARVYWGAKQDREDVLPDISVRGEGKLITTWSAIKSSY